MKKILQNLLFGVLLFANINTTFAQDQFVA